MKTLNVMDLSFTYKAALRGYESVTVTRVWNGIGSMELAISSEITNADKIAQDDLLWFDQEYDSVYIVEKIEEELTGSVFYYQITAHHINSLLQDFITVPAFGSDYDMCTGTREAIVRAWVNANCIVPEDTGRAQYPIALGTLRSLGSSITEQTRLAVLSDEIARVLTTEDLGWALVLDLTNDRFTFEIYGGVDRTTLQSANSRAIFGLRYGNVASWRKVVDKTAAKTVAYVGGTGEGAARMIQEVDASGSGRRKEVFIDARDISTTTELTERGLQALAEAEAVDSYEFTTLDRQFAYRTDYDLGDFVTVVAAPGDYQHLQIQKLKEIYDHGAISVVPEFGQPERTLGKVINAIVKQLATVQSTEAGSCVPAGLILANAGQSTPDGWLECDGAAVSRSGYAALFATIGTTYGAGNGSTTFSLPDLRGRILVGLDSGQAEFTTLGQTGGEKAHTLTIAEIPAHTHDVKMDGDTTPDGGTGATASEDTYNTTLTGGAMSTGGGGSHNNLQPYMALKWIIKY